MLIVFPYFTLRYFHRLSPLSPSFYPPLLLLDHYTDSDCDSDFTDSSSDVEGILVADGLAATPSRLRRNKQLSTEGYQVKVDSTMLQELRDIATSPSLPHEISHLPTHYDEYIGPVEQNGSTGAVARLDLSPTPIRFVKDDEFGPQSASSSMTVLSCPQMVEDSSESQHARYSNNKNSNSNKNYKTHKYGRSYQGLNHQTSPTAGTSRHERRLSSQSAQGYGGRNNSNPAHFDRYSPRADANGNPHWQWVSNIDLSCALWIENVPAFFRSAESFRSWIALKLDAASDSIQGPPLSRFIKFVHLIYRTDLPLSSLACEVEGHPAVLVIHGRSSKEAILTALRGQSCHDELLRVQQASDIGLTQNDVRAFIRPQEYGPEFFEVFGVDKKRVMEDATFVELTLPELPECMRSVDWTSNRSVILLFRQQKEYHGVAVAKLLPMSVVDSRCTTEPSIAKASCKLSLTWLYRTTSLPIDFSDLRYSKITSIYYQPKPSTLEVFPLQKPVGSNTLRRWRHQEHEEDLQVQVKQLKLDSIAEKTNPATMGRLLHAAQFAEPFIPTTPTTHLMMIMTSTTTTTTTTTTTPAMTPAMTPATTIATTVTPLHMQTPVRAKSWTNKKPTTHYAHRAATNARYPVENTTF